MNHVPSPEETHAAGRCPLLPPEVQAPLDCPLLGKPSIRVRLSTVETLALILGVEFWERAIVYEARVHGSNWLRVDLMLVTASGAAFFFCHFLTWLELRRRHSK